MILIIDRKETVVRQERKTLCIHREGQSMQRVPVNLLEQVIVYGNPLIEAGVWRVLSTAGVPAILMSTRGAQQAAMLASGLATRLPLRRLQHRCADGPVAVMALACWFVDRKLQSYDLPLCRLDHAAKDLREQFLQQRDEAREKLCKTNDISTLLGLEGATANAWFALLSKSLPYKWRFAGRNRRPPLDPVNALLSLGYTLLGSDVRQVLIGEGLDPALGFLHQFVPGREALVLDFTELFRGGVDDFVLCLLEHLGPMDFSYTQQHGCRLKKKARPIFFKAWADCRENWPRNPTKEMPEIQTVPLQEQIRGQVMAARHMMKRQVSELD